MSFMVIRVTLLCGGIVGAANRDILKIFAFDRCKSYRTHTIICHTRVNDFYHTLGNQAYDIRIIQQWFAISIVWAVNNYGITNPDITCCCDRKPTLYYIVTIVVWKITSNNYIAVNEYLTSR